ncbi:hypothetical protein SporoP37_12165 [Sporosarcina sp. P37]|uniref:hypothetical protein n=1 Tax=unclassified Sporosarcina TaxID=2647733 RepID=UPI000A17DC49|nr:MULTISPECIES: hypothetical protein [unclassified Sporosarcina]ARK25337.1 hypothetical protein SporoP37_12165 [Sporosarcina sp. P37]PID16276.1 hypothetical protein CSV62_15740 [Sporosarcina sp. P35]
MMKILKKFFLASALLMLVFVSTTKTEAATDIPDGVFFSKTGEYYNPQQLNSLSTQKIGKLFSENSLLEIYIHYKGIGAASLAQSNASDFITAANKNGNKDNPGIIIPNRTYIDPSGNNVEVIDTGEQVTNFEVLSID